MAWGKSSRGVDDLLTKLQSDPNATSLVILRTRRFGPTEASQFASALASNTTLKELFASGHDIGVEGAAAFGRALATNTTLSVLCLGDSGLGDAGVEALVGEGLHRNCGLQRLDLEYKSLTGGSHVARLLKAHPALRDLRLGRNQIGDEGVEALSQGLRVAPALTSLDLAANAFGQQGAEALARALPPSLTALDLSGNALAGAAGAALLSALAAAHNATLTSLKLRDCQLDAQAAAALALWSDTGAAATAPTDAAAAGTDAHDCCAITELDVSGNGALGPAGALAAVRACSNLSRLSLAHTGAGDEGAASLAAHAPPGLTFLDVSGNGIGGPGAAALLGGLRSARELRLFANAIGDSGAAVTAAALAAAAAAGAALETLDLGGNSMTHGGLEPLLAAARACPRLRVLELGGNKIDEVAEAAIGQLQEARPDLDVAFRTNGGDLAGGVPRNGT